MNLGFDLADQTERLTLERYEEALRMKIDMRARRGEPVPLVKQLQYSTLIQQLKELSK